MTVPKSPEDKAQDALNTATAGVHDAVDTTAAAVSRVAGRASDSTTDAIESATGAVNGAVDSAQENIAAGLRRATTVAAGVSDLATGRVRKFPIRIALVVAVAAVIVGFVVGAVTSKSS